MGGSSALSKRTPAYRPDDKRFAGISQAAPGVQVTNLRGLRRFHAARGDAWNTPIPILYVGHSIAFGVGSDNLNATSLSTSRVDCQAAQLRRMFAATYGNPGEGWIPASTSGSAGDSRISISSATTPGNVGAFGLGQRLASGQSVTLAVPATTEGAAVASVDIVLWNGAAGATAPTYVWNGGSSTGTPTTPAGDFYYTVNVPTAGVAGNLVISGPGSGAAFLAGFILRTALAGGVPVHRIGYAGGTTGMLTGTNLSLSGADQDKIIRGIFQWVTRVVSANYTSASGTVTVPGATGTDVGKPITVDQSSLVPAGATIGTVPSGTTVTLANSLTASATSSGRTTLIGPPFLVIIQCMINDWQFEGGGGFTGQNGISPTTYSANLQQIITYITAAGGCTLLVADPPSTATNAGTHTQADYMNATKALATAQDHVAALALTDLWGTDNTVLYKAGIQFSGSVHPTRRGHGQVAQVLHRILTSPVGEGSPVV